MENPENLFEFCLIISYKQEHIAEENKSAEKMNSDGSDSYNDN